VWEIMIVAVGMLWGGLPEIALTTGDATVRSQTLGEGGGGGVPLISSANN
jgi:hypothetical protein